MKVIVANSATATSSTQSRSVEFRKSLRPSQGGEVGYGLVVVEVWGAAPGGISWLGRVVGNCLGGRGGGGGLRGAWIVEGVFGWEWLRRKQGGDV